MLKTLKLQQFRNHALLELELGELTLITGPNGSGKTSVLEAVSLLSVAESWKTERDREVVQWGQDFARVEAASETQSFEAVVQIAPATKRIKVDGISKRLGELLGVLPTSVFQPEDSLLITGAPALRRRLLDRLLAQIEPGYAAALISLQKVLKQRNRLLKRVGEGLSDPDELEYWDIELARGAIVIQTARSAVLERMEPVVGTLFSGLIGEEGALKIGYLRSPHSKGVLSLAEFLRHLKENRVKELANQSSMYGPHREDLEFEFRGHPASEGMSRGQVRALVLALKLAELELLEESLGRKPILLLDDIFSEFDEFRQEKVRALVTGYQTLMTSTAERADLGKGVRRVELTI